MTMYAVLDVRHRTSMIYIYIFIYTYIYIYVYVYTYGLYISMDIPIQTVYPWTYPCKVILAQVCNMSQALCYVICRIPGTTEPSVWGPGWARFAAGPRYQTKFSLGEAIRICRESSMNYSAYQWSIVVAEFDI